MKKNSYIVWKVLLIIGVLFLTSIRFQAFAQDEPEMFPFFRSFLDKNINDIKFPEGSNNEANSAGIHSLVDQGLQLTSGISQVGAFFLPNHLFTTDDGFMIEFEYIMKGDSTKQTDGIIMFLVDAQDKYIAGDNLKFGFAGAGFGYTHRNAYQASDRQDGMKGAYIAVALDQGNFKVLREEGNEVRSGIHYYGTTTGSGSTGSQMKKYHTPSMVTIRGAAGNGPKELQFSSYGQNLKFSLTEGQWGYPVLATRYTGGKKGTQEMLRENGFRLIPSTGLYEQHTAPSITAPFDIAGWKDFNDSQDEAYRKLMIQLKPNPDITMGGYIITVWIKHGNTITTVIKDFTYPSKLSYIENGYVGFVGGYPQIPGTPPIIEYTVPRPEKLAIGFAASTGTDNPYINIIRNLSITPAFAALSVNDDLNHRRGPVTVQPLKNDKAYSGLGLDMVEGSEYLDPATFRFWTSETNCLGSTYTYNDSGKGRWVYDPVKAEVLFFPDKGYKGEVSIMYDVLGKEYPYNQEKFRSKRATISITIADNQPTYSR